MQRVVRIVVSLTAAGLVAWLLYQRVGPGGGREAARLDRGLAIDGDRGRIDPHGPSGTTPSSPLLLEARLEEQTETDLRIEVELAVESTFDSVFVRAARFDAPGSPEPAWSEVVWRGRVDPGASVRFESRIPLAGALPSRVQMTAQAIGGAGGRYSTTAIIRPESVSD